MSIFDDPNREAVGLGPIWSGADASTEEPPVEPEEPPVEEEPPDAEPAEEYASS